MGSGTTGKARGRRAVLGRVFCLGALGAAGCISPFKSMMLDDSCWNRARVEEARARPMTLEGFSDPYFIPVVGDYAGRETLTDSSNWAHPEVFTDVPCSVSVSRDAAGGFVVRTSLLTGDDGAEVPVALVSEINAPSGFYIGAAGEDVVVLQQQWGTVVHLAHTTYEEDGTVDYGRCGGGAGRHLKQCNLMER